MTFHNYLGLLLSILILSSCQEKQVSSDLLATAYEHELYMGEVRDQINVSSIGQDSMVVIKKYVDNWLMEKIIDRKAKLELGKDPELEKLVENYRKEIYAQALLENVVTGKAVDSRSTTSDSLLVGELQEDMVQFLYVKVPIGYDNDTLKLLWKTEDINALSLFCDFVGGQTLLDINKWYYKRKLENISPKKLLNKINYSRKDSYSYNDSINKFYVKILDHKKAGESMPQDLVNEKYEIMGKKDRARKVSDEWKRDLFESEIKKKEIQVYGKF